MVGLSTNIQKISPSSTLLITSMAKKMIREGKDVISFGAGEPDFDTPVAVKEAAKKAIDAGFTKYTPADGTAELKQAIVDKFQRDNGLTYTQKQIIVSCGAKHSLYNVFQAIVNPDDEVLIIEPYWVSYTEMVKLARGTPKFIRTKKEGGFKASAKDIKTAVTKKTKALVLNSPSNPAGIVYSRKELQEIADIAVSEKFYVISDEIYEKLIYDGNKHVSIGSLGGDIFKQTITVNGVSKAYAMTGWRIGYLGAPDDVAYAVGNLQSHSTSNPASISQKASLAALHMDEGEIEKMRSEYEKRRDLITGLLDQIPQFSYIRPEGAFYVYTDISKTGIKARDFAGKLLEDKLVAVIPGEEFGSDRHIRFSFAMAPEKIKEGINRIKSWVKP
ncbi:MAG: pyridoxal phosphate-dependent aminotransferase [Candidatus Omnitrophica bacterium]|nr:pyridoxal phosphate-dependent aminotransferase [Candidatus Omnitrophota bacterium]